MKHDKSYLRKKFLLQRRKGHSTIKNFNFNSIFKLIRKNFNRKKITIAGYYPANYEVNILNFLKLASKKKYKITLPVIKTRNLMSFKIWTFGSPLYVSKYGILEQKNLRKSFIPVVILVPLVAFDDQLNRIGYGKGYYDRILKKIRNTKKKTIFLGIAYSFQKCKSIPANKHDFKLDYIFTEQGIISSNQ